MIKIKDLQVTGRLFPLSVTFDAGDIIHVIGPNGSGKSSFLSALAGVLAYQGEIHFARQNIAKLSSRELALWRAYLPQQQVPAFQLDVFQYLALSLPNGIDIVGDDVNRTIHQLCDKLQLTDKLARSIQQLSGGEWQRVRLIGMCLQLWPEWNTQSQLLILDEPAAPLDIAQEALLYELLQEISQLGITIVMANHDLNRTFQYASQVMLLEQGRLVAYGKPMAVLTAEQLEAVFKTAVTLTQVAERTVLIFD